MKTDRTSLIQNSHQKTPCLSTHHSWSGRLSRPPFTLRCLWTHTLMVTNRKVQGIFLCWSSTLQFPYLWNESKLIFDGYQQKWLIQWTSFNLSAFTRWRVLISHAALAMCPASPTEILFYLAVDAEQPGLWGQEDNQACTGASEQSKSTELKISVQAWESR